MKKYLSFFRIRFSNTLQYRSAAIAGVITQFAWGGMKLLLYTAFYATDPTTVPMEFSALSSYVWLHQGFLALFAFWFFENDIFTTITDGGIACEMLRPVSLYDMWMVKNLASRTAKALLRSVPIFTIVIFLPKPYNLSLPYSPLAFIMFLITLMLGLLVVVSLCMLIYISTIYTMSSLGIRLVVMSVVELLSGGIVPLPFFPDKVRAVVELLPFAYMDNLPLRIYSGDIQGQEMWYMLLIQIFWLIVLQLIGRLWMKRSLKNIVVQGG